LHLKMQQIRFLVIRSLDYVFGQSDRCWHEDDMELGKHMRDPPNIFPCFIAGM
jgi:hypothetical protein